VTADSEGDHIPNTRHTCLALLLIAVMTLSTVGAVGAASGAKGAPAIPAQSSIARPAIVGTGAPAVFRYPTQLWMQATSQDIVTRLGRPASVILSGALQAGTARLGGQRVTVYMSTDGRPYVHFATRTTVASGANRGIYAVRVNGAARHLYTFYATYGGATNAGASKSNFVNVRISYNRYRGEIDFMTLTCLATSQAVRPGGHIGLSGFLQSGHSGIANVEVTIGASGSNGYRQRVFAHTDSAGRWAGTLSFSKRTPPGPYRLGAVTGPVYEGSTLRYYAAGSNQIGIAVL